ncbi:hypothetical protein JTB14_022530 [Gonioctena quinquepunctata]|nr:hypothetical protein JTB14_022530 [Gonioctena quinquepunctata]
MDPSQSDFDYQSVLETYGLQGEIVKTATGIKDQSNSLYHNDYDNFKKLQSESTYKHEILFDILLEQKRHLQKLNRIVTKQSVSNKDIAEFQDEISMLNSELQKQSDDSMKKMGAMDDDLQKLFSQFEGKTLSTLIGNTSNDLISSSNIKRHLYREYEKTRNFHFNFDEFVNSQRGCALKNWEMARRSKILKRK